MINFIFKHERFLYGACLVYQVLTFITAVWHQDGPFWPVATFLCAAYVAHIYSEA